MIIGLGATWAAHAAKLSLALRAFVASMFPGNSKLHIEIRADVAVCSRGLLRGGTC